MYRSRTDAAYCYKCRTFRGLRVCLCRDSGTPESPTETAETNRDAVLGMQWGSVGPKNRVSDRVQVGAT